MPCFGKQNKNGVIRKHRCIRVSRATSFWSLVKREMNCRRGRSNRELFLCLTVHDKCTAQLIMSCVLSKPSLTISMLWLKLNLQGKIRLGIVTLTWYMRNITGRECLHRPVLSPVYGYQNRNASQQSASQWKQLQQHPRRWKRVCIATSRMRKSAKAASVSDQ